MKKQWPLKIFSLIIAPASESENLNNYMYIYIKKYFSPPLIKESKPPLSATVTRSIPPSFEKIIRDMWENREIN